jgi:ligand-binding sensor domain-containing protein
MKSGALETIAFPFANTARGFAVGTDDRLWMAGGDSPSVLSLDPGTKTVAAINFQTSAISALYVDSAARVWYADDATGGIGYYDQTKRAIVSVSVPGHASVTALAMDRNGTLWAGTAAGEVLSVRLGVAVAGAGAGGPVVDLVRDASGGMWSYAAAPGTVIYRSLTAGGGARIAAVAASSVALDGLGRAWLADPAGADFYIALNEER